MHHSNEVCFLIDRREFDKEFHDKAGYKTISPYRDTTLIGRLFREFSFRLLPCTKEFWYNKEIAEKEYRYIIVNDALITPEYLCWIRQIQPNAKVFYRYSNLVGKARNLHPDQIPEGVRVVTYDERDARKYNIGYLEKSAYIAGRGEPSLNPAYDVVYIGRDKGRAEYLLNLENKLQNMGLKTKFLIMPNGRFYKPKPFYSKPIPYAQILELVGNTRAVLNIVLEGQTGMTIRDMESAFRGVKLVTNNPEILQFDLLLEDNVFILGKRDLSQLRDFLSVPPVPVPEEIIADYSMEAYVERLINM